MVRFENYAQRGYPKPAILHVRYIKHLGAAAYLLERKKSIKSAPGIDHYLKQAVPCPCAAHNFWLRPFRYGASKQLGIICIKCNRIALGQGLKGALDNRNANKLFK